MEACQLGFERTRSLFFHFLTFTFQYFKILSTLCSLCFAPLYLKFIIQCMQDSFNSCNSYSSLYINNIPKTWNHEMRYQHKHSQTFHWKFLNRVELQQPPSLQQTLCCFTTHNIHKIGFFSTSCHPPSSDYKSNIECCTIKYNNFHFGGSWLI